MGGMGSGAAQAMTRAFKENRLMSRSAKNLPELTRNSLNKSGRMSRTVDASLIEVVASSNFSENDETVIYPDDRNYRSSSKLANLLMSGVEPIESDSSDEASNTSGSILTVPASPISVPTAEKSMRKKKSYAAKTMTDMRMLLVRTPEIHLVEIETSSRKWGTAIFVDLHNAVRSELKDLYTILNAIYSKKACISREEDEGFSEWWNLFSRFALTYFEIEEEILFPLLQPDRLSNMEADRLITTMQLFWVQRKHLHQTLCNITEYVEGLFVLPMQKLYFGIRHSVDDYVPDLLEYFRRQEAVLPHFLHKIYDESVWTDVEQRSADFILSKDDGRDLVCMLGSGYSKAEDFLRWKKSALRGPRRLRYSTWETRFLKSHKKIVMEFELASAVWTRPPSSLCSSLSFSSPSASSRDEDKSDTSSHKSWTNLPEGGNVE
mmetsp:Transcript_7533/g.15327  ORF Transcript_7533/g.15327 Transcript_7533/m.15327 type:complete len:435 (-) Transcript_7533:523-1827(-)